MASAVPSHDTDDTGFATRVRSAMAWRWGSQIVAQIIAWSSTIMVVRLLTPTDYGLFAMTQVVLTALAFLSGHGFASSLVQTADVSRRRIGQVFGILLLFNGTLAVIQFLSAPMMAAYYREPLVEDMLRIQAVMFLTVPFTSLPSELLAKRLEFRIQGKISVLAAILAAIVALALAWFDFGVWALVYAPISGFVFRAIALTVAARSLVPPVFDLRGARDILHFGGAMTLCQLFWIIQSQSDIFIAGRLFDTHDLGLYAEALFLTLIVTGRFLPPVKDVAYPAYAELHRSGKSLAPYFLTCLRTVLLVTAPIYFGLALTAEPAVVTLFGEKWVEMAPIAAGLSLAMPAMALQIVCGPATNAMGKPAVDVLSNLCGAILFPACFLVGVAYGPAGLVTAWWIAAPILLAVTLALTLPKVGLAWGTLLRALAPIMLASAMMVAMVLAVEGALPPGWPPFVLLAIEATCGAAVYAAALRLFWPHLIAETWAMLRPAGTEQPPVSAPDPSLPGPAAA